MVLRRLIETLIRRQPPHALIDARAGREKRAREAAPDMRVMFVTGFASVATEGGKPAVPGAAVLSKPFHLRDLVAKVKHLLAA